MCRLIRRDALFFERLKAAGIWDHMIALEMLFGERTSS
jgi:hypothetical protein